MLSALEYLKEKNRMTKGCGKESCPTCPLSHYKNGFNELCGTFQTKYPEKAIEIVENWAKEHPVKTYLDDFLEKYPNAPIEDDGTPKFCPHDLYKKANRCELDVRCVDCWKQPLIED